jgi:DNA adenine methylase
VRDFGAYRGTLSRWHFTWGDFEKLELEDDDFIYSDPPYDVPFRQYSRDGFEWSEQVRLARWLARHKGPVVLSNQATERILTLYESLGFHLKLLNAPRSISRTGDRTPAREVLATRGFD